MEDVIAAAARTGTFLELNAAPDRLDVDENLCRSARDAGVRVSVATDAHSVKGLDFMRYGVNQARRGWLERGDVINTLTYRSLARLL
jgi:DNA polymerase (family 10)